MGSADKTEAIRARRSWRRRSRSPGRSRRQPSAENPAPSWITPMIMVIHPHVWRLEKDVLRVGKVVGVAHCGDPVDDAENAGVINRIATNAARPVPSHAAFLSVSLSQHRCSPRFERAGEPSTTILRRASPIWMTETRRRPPAGIAHRVRRASRRICFLSPAACAGLGDSYRLFDPAPPE